MPFLIHFHTAKKKTKITCRLQINDKKIIIKYFCSFNLILYNEKKIVKKLKNKKL